MRIQTAEGVSTTTCVSSSAQASFGVHQLNNKASILDKLVFLFSRYLRGTWFIKKDPTENSLAVQWLGLSAFTARPGFNPGWGAKSLQAKQHDQINKKDKT